MPRSENKAQTELERLQNATHRHLTAGQAQRKLDASKNAVTANLRSLDRDQDGEANFGTPEAVATAVGASFLLGPVGGILLGVAQGILGKEMRQNALDAFNAEQSALTDAADVFKTNLDQLRLTATNDEDLEQLSAYQAKADAGIRMMRSGIPELENQGAQLYGQAFSDVTAYTQNQELQRIEAETLEAQRRIDLDNQQYSRHSSLLDDYDAQSANYEAVVMNSNAAKEAIMRGNPVDINAALVMVNKALDPTSVVRPEEAKALGNAGTLIEQAQAKINEWARTGQAMTVEQRKELVQLVDTIEGTARGFQMQRDIRFQERAVDAGLPAKYINDFRRVQDLPAFKPPAAGYQSPPDQLKQATDSYQEMNAGALEKAQIATTDVIEGAAETARSSWESFKSWYRDDSGDRKRRRQARELPTN